jgi:Ca2+-binding EF-hand superfamily protein
MQPEEMLTTVFADIDTDGDGFASMAELQAIYPDLTEEQFLEIDTDGDGLVNDEEILIAVEAELIADPEGDA